MLSKFTQWRSRYHCGSIQHIRRRLSTKMTEFKTVKVQVYQGVLVGQELRLPNGHSYNSFQGVPYAVPPLGPLRFKSPIALERFETPELNCTQHRDVSFHRDPMTTKVFGSENCLHLNVYAPKSDKPMPVMVFVHGGGFCFGSGNSDYYLPLHLMEEDVVVVTINYRLGALGFLSMPEEGIWGNAGLKDQRMALQWIQQNISQFNGDPKNVTLFGESAGACCVHLHAYARHANELFHKAIMQSGTSNMEWVFQSNPGYKARRLAEKLGCTSQDTREIIKHLQSEHATPLAILDNTSHALTADERRRSAPFCFKPIIEDSSSPDIFIDSPIFETFKKRDTLAVPTIMGYNSAEGITMLVNAVRKLNEFEKDLERLVPSNIPKGPEDADERELARQMRKFYLGGRPIDPKSLEGLKDMLTDYHFVVAKQQVAEWQARHQTRTPLYFYRFNYVGGRNIYKKIFKMEHMRGACHGEELFYLFQMAGDDAPLSAEDAQFIKRICRLWANFARCNDPTPESDKSLDFKWAPVRAPIDERDPFVLDYLSIDKEFKMLQNPDKERMEFWRSIYKQYTTIDYSRLSAKL